MRQHIRTSFGDMRRAPFQAIAAVSVLALTFFVTTLLILLVYSSNQILHYFETRPQIIAFIRDEAPEPDVELLRAKLSADPRIASVNFVSKEQAHEIYKDATSDNPLLGELVSPSVFPASIEFSVTDLSFTQAIIAEVSTEQTVDNVSFTANIGGDSALSDVVERLRQVTFYVRLGGAVTVAVLMATSFLVLMVVIGMRVTMKRPEIESLSFIGATNWFIRAPIVFEAMSYAFIGVLAGWLAAAVLMLYATPTILSYFGEVPVLPRESTQFLTLMAALLAVEFVVGVLIALFGSMVAVGRSLRSVR